MTRIAAQRFHLLKSGVVLAGLLFSTASSFAVDLGHDDITPLPLRLQSSVTIHTDVITLGDVFSGLKENADKAIAPAPAPGQRLTLPAEWLGTLAKTHDIAWQPTTQFDRVVVFRPGQNIPSADILAAVTAELAAQGMPGSYRLKTSTPLPAITVPANGSKAIAVREAFFDAEANTFSAVAEIPAGDPRAQFIQMKGEAFAIAMVPVLKQPLSRDSVITADMIEMAELPENKIGPEAVLDVNLIVGKAVKGYVRAGQPLRAADVRQVTFISVPVFRAEMRRGTKIGEAHIDWLNVNASDLPDNAIIDAEQLIGRVPKRQLAAGLPLRTTDVQTIDLIEVPVAAREIRRGETLTEDDLRWTTMDRNQIGAEIVQSLDNLVGHVAHSAIRTGQPFRNHNVARPVTIQKNKLVTLIYSVRTMKLTAKAKMLEDGAIGQVVRVVNTKSNTNLFAEVLDADTVRVTEQQAAMN